MNNFDLKGRRAVVTGAAQGFGRAITERLLASGASVALWDVDPDESARTARELNGHGTISTHTVDVSHLAQVDAATAATVRALGGIDILVANAGIAGPNHKTWEYPPDDWQRVIEVDLMSVFYCCRAVIPLTTSVPAVAGPRRGLLMALCGIIVLAANVIDAVDRGSSALNVIAIATGAFLLFYGFAVIGRSGGSSDT